MTSFFHQVPKGLVISLLLGFAISSDGVVFPFSGQTVRQNPRDPITLDDYLSNGALRPGGFTGQWAQGSDDLIRIVKPDSVVDYNVTSGDEDVVVYIKNITDLLPEGSQYSGIIFSNDGDYALIQHGRSSVWRYSTTAKYHIFNLNARTMIGQLLVPEGSKGDGDGETLQYVKWSPTGNGIAFVYNFNVYYKADAQQETEVRVVTTDGADEETAIYNGISDWVYEEEMFGGPNALWISENQENLAYMRFDDSKVEMFQWPMYGEPGRNDSLYPKYSKIRYPKVGTDNPSADIYITSLKDSSEAPKKVTIPGATQNDIIGTVMWASESELLVANLNREQTRSQWYLCPSDTATCIEIYKYELSQGWIDMNTPRVSADGQMFVFVRSVKQDPGEESYKQIVMFMANGTEKIISKGRYSVKGILGWDEPNHKIYFSGTRWNATSGVADPSETQIYSVSDDGENTLVCVTCTVTNSYDELCGENSATFSAEYTRFIHRCNGPTIPETTTRFTNDSRPVEMPGPTYVNNSAVRDAYASKALPLYDGWELQVGDNFTARGRLYFPENFDSLKKYPLLVSVYGGPGSQNIGQSFGLTWETTLVSDKDILVLYIDGRGTSGSSSDHMFTLHRKLGTVEIEDQIAMAKDLIETYSFIDSNKTAIWGWSYGGYATANVLETDVDNVFKCGISVAPVTSWRYYDTIYTERYMALPTIDSNQQAYINSDLTTKENIENLRNKQFMLVHGNADDNVHYQNSMMLARALEQADIFFHQLSYPDENHGISGPGMRRHLYHSLERFLFDECYKQEDPTVADPTTTTSSTPSTTSSTEGPTETTTAGSTMINNLFFVTGFSLVIMMFRST